MESEEIKVPKAILQRLDQLLGQDGFKQSIPGLFVRNQNSDWRAWIGVTGFPHALYPTVGVYNNELVSIADAARLKLGRPSQQFPDSGPPLIMVTLERIIGNDTDCMKRITWIPDLGSDNQSDPSPLADMKSTVADDLVYCIRKKAYPFFAGHMTFQNIWDAGRQGMGSPALPDYIPLILMKLGRREDVTKYVDQRLKKIPNEKFASDYRAYVDELLKLVPA
jgi:hypothetical protein